MRRGRGGRRERSREVSDSVVVRSVLRLIAITGWTDFTLEEMQTIGDRRLAMLRVFNQREGLGRNDDRLPKKFFKALGGTGPTAGVALDEADIESAKDMYYELAGCDVDGRVTRERLQMLGLEWLI